MTNTYLNTNIMVAFETWPGGHSALYKGQDAVDFIEAHEASNTFAKLHVYEDDAEGEKAYEELMSEPEEQDEEMKWARKEEGKMVTCYSCNEKTQAFMHNFVSTKGFYCSQCI